MAIYHIVSPLVQLIPECLLPWVWIFLQEKPLDIPNSYANPNSNIILQ
jgi:hypothetical protein